jgi:hypothetical protein
MNETKNDIMDWECISQFSDDSLILLLPVMYFFDCQNLPSIAPDLLFLPLFPLHLRVSLLPTLYTATCGHIVVSPRVHF